MKDRFNAFLDTLSEFLAHRKGLLPMIGVVLVLLNWIVQLLPGNGFIASTDVFLHLGVIIAILGILVSWAL